MNSEIEEMLAAFAADYASEMSEGTSELSTTPQGGTTMTVLDDLAESIRASRPLAIEGIRLPRLGGKSDFAQYYGSELSRFTGTVDTVTAVPSLETLGEGTAYPVKEENVLALIGTIFSPAQFLRINGKVIAGPMYHKQISVKEMHEGDASRNLHFELDVYAKQVFLFACGKVQIGSVRKAAAAAFGFYYDRVICNRRSGFCISAKIAIDNRMGTELVGVTTPLMSEGLAALAKGLRCDVALDNASGLLVIVKRDPVTDLDCLLQLRLVVVESTERAILLSDVNAKRMGGDGDGDPIQITFHKNYDRHQAARDLGSIKGFGIKEDSADFGTVAWSVQEARTYKFQTGQQLAVGLAVKSLFQGLITNYFARIAASGVVLSLRDKLFLDACAGRCGIDPGDRMGIITAVMNSVKIGETVMTEIIMDFRKHIFGAPEQFAKELFAIARAAGRGAMTMSMPSTLAGIKKGNKEFDLEAINAVLRVLGSERPADFLASLPLQNTVVGGGVQPTEEARFALAETFSAMGADKAMLALSGLACEPRTQVQTPSAKINEEDPELSPGWPALDGTPWQYVTKALRMRGISYVAKLPTGISVKLAHGRELMLPWTLEVTPAKADGTASYVTVTTAGGSKRYARLCVRPAVRNLDKVKDSLKASTLIREHGLEVVHFMDQIVDMVDALNKDIIAAQNDPKITFVVEKWVEDGSKRVTKLLDESTRLPGTSNKGDEVVFGRMETHSIQVSIEQPRCADAQENYHAHVALAEVIESQVLIDPLSGLVIRPFVGTTSKSKPLSVAFLRKEGCAYPNHIYAVNVFLGNMDRIMRESGTPLQAKRLKNPQQILTGSKKIGKLAERRLDATWVMVNGVNAGLCSDGQHNADMGYLTPYGKDRYEPAAMRRVFRGLSIEQLEQVCKEYGFGNASDMEMAGWTVTPVKTPLASRTGKGRRLSTLTYDVVSTEDADTQTLYKIWLSGGHKFLAPQTRKDYYVVVAGRMVMVDGMVSQETMVGFQDGDKWDGGKKQDATVLAGLLSILGKHDWSESEMLDVDSLKEEAELSLLMNDMDTSGLVDLYDEDGNVVGQCVPMLLPSYVCYEDDRSSKVQANGFKRSLNITRLLSETVTLPEYEKAVLTGLADMAAGKEVDTKFLGNLSFMLKA